MLFLVYVDRHAAGGAEFVLVEVPAEAVGAEGRGWVVDREGCGGRIGESRAVLEVNGKLMS